VAVAAAPAGGAATPPRAGDTTADPTAVPVARGTARVTGTVRDSAGRPVRGARASVWGTAAEATAGADGTFTLGGLPAGTHTLEVRAIGYALRQLPVDLAAGRAAPVAVRLDRAPTLAPVTVFGTASPLAEFLDRRLHNRAGRFITAEDLARRNVYDVSDALRGMAPLEVVRYRGFRTMLYGRKTIPDGGKPGGMCPAKLILNGRPLPPGDDINLWVGPREVVGIEVYPDGAAAPLKFRQAEPDMDGCSIVVFWTRR
jgi:hypothetical protein